MRPHVHARSCAASMGRTSPQLAIKTTPKENIACTPTTPGDLTPAPASGMNSYSSGSRSQINTGGTHMLHSHHGLVLQQTCAGCRFNVRLLRGRQHKQQVQRPIRDRTIAGNGDGMGGGGPQPSPTVRSTSFFSPIKEQMPARYPTAEVQATATQNLHARIPSTEVQPCSAVHGMPWVLTGSRAAGKDLAEDSRAFADAAAAPALTSADTMALLNTCNGEQRGGRS